MNYFHRVRQPPPERTVAVAQPSDTCRRVQQPRTTTTAVAEPKLAIIDWLIYYWIIILSLLNNWLLIDYLMIDLLFDYLWMISSEFVWSWPIDWGSWGDPCTFECWNPDRRAGRGGPPDPCGCAPRRRRAARCGVGIRPVRRSIPSIPPPDTRADCASVSIQTAAASHPPFRPRLLPAGSAKIRPFPARQRQQTKTNKTNAIRSHITVRWYLNHSLVVVS